PFLGAIHQKKLLVEDRICERRVESLSVGAARDQLSRRCQHPGSCNLSAVDSVAQLRVTVDPRVTEVATGGKAALKVLTRELGTGEDPLLGGLYDSQQHVWPEFGVKAPAELGLGRHHHIEQ